MTAIKITANGKAALADIKRLQSKLEKANRQALYVVGKELNQDLMDGLRQNPKRSGISYRVTKKGGRKRLSGRSNRGHRGGLHIASTPEEFPARLNGDLRESMGFDVTGSNKLTIGSRSGGAPKGKVLEYAAWLEERNHFIEKTIDSNRREIEQALGQSFQREMNK
jgi:hypothetical protein